MSDVTSDSSNKTKRTKQTAGKLSGPSEVAQVVPPPPGNAISAAASSSSELPATYEPTDIGSVAETASQARTLPQPVAETAEINSSSAADASNLERPQEVYKVLLFLYFQLMKTIDD